MIVDISYYLSTSPSTRSIVDISTTSSCIPSPLITIPHILNRATPTELIMNLSIIPATIRFPALCPLGFSCKRLIR